MNQLFPLGYFTWDPDRNFFVIPGIHHAIAWYGVIFAFGFLVGYFFVRLLFTYQLLNLGREKSVAKKESLLLADRFSVLVILGTVIGARLGHVLFYGWPFYSRNPLEIFKIWEGGLASHGGAIGILIALVFFLFWARRIISTLTFLSLLDLVVIPAAFASACIRAGNFINQEILGIPTTLPWGVIFLHPIEGIAGVPLHPVQLYESIFYLCVCCLLFYLWIKDGRRIGSGLLAGTFFVLVFGFRFFIEFLKLPQSQLIDETSFLNMGQWLSLPFILLGIILLATYPFRRLKSHL